VHPHLLYNLFIKLWLYRVLDAQAVPERLGETLLTLFFLSFRFSELALKLVDPSLVLSHLFRVENVQLPNAFLIIIHLLEEQPLLLLKLLRRWVFRSGSLVQRL
jgi:hypothetical protein